MNTKALRKIIDTLVLKKYDWIEDYDIDVYFDSPFERYTIVYYVYPEDYGSFTVTKEMRDVESTSDNLFKMLGTENYQILDDVEFRVK